MQRTILVQQVPLMVKPLVERVNQILIMMVLTFMVMKQQLH